MDEDRPTRSDEHLDRTDEDMIGQDVDEIEEVEEVEEKDQMGGGGTPE